MLLCLGTPLIVLAKAKAMTTAPSGYLAGAISPRLGLSREAPASHVQVVEWGGGGDTAEAATPRGVDGRSRAVDALAVAIAITGLLTTVFGIGERRWRQLAGLALFLLGLALYGGCDPLHSALRASSVPSQKFGA